MPSASSHLLQSKARVSRYETYETTQAAANKSLLLAIAISDFNKRATFITSLPTIEPIGLHLTTLEVRTLSVLTNAGLALIFLYHLLKRRIRK